MLAACSLVLLLVGVGWALGGGEAPRVIVPGDKESDSIWISSTWRDPPPIVRTEDDIGSFAPPVIDGVVAGLNPVDDDTFLDEPVTLATRDERAIMVGTGVWDGEPGEGEPRPGGGYGEGDGNFIRPPIDTFIVVEIQPELLHPVVPEYPRFAKTAGIEGRVIIKALIGPKGSVLDAVVFDSSGHLLLDEAALAVAWKYKYKPAIQSGRPIAIWVTYKVDFKLD
jgi:protein TonB